MTLSPTSFTAAELLSDINDWIGSTFDQIDWAEDEISRAQRRHPAETDRLYHAFSLLRATHERMNHELVYRAHCRELLERVATGHDTRPGTAAEICIACSEASLIAPLASPVAGLFGRMWAQAFPEHSVFDDRQPHHEALEGSAIDDLETDARHRLTVDDRHLTGIACQGKHHGTATSCRYTATTELATIAS